MANVEKRLLKNTGLFAIANILTKIIQFFLIPLYTHFLTTSEYGIIDLADSVATIIVPIISLGIIESTFRFSMEKEADKKSVFTFSFLFVIFSLIFLPLFKVFELYPSFKGIGIYVSLIIITDLTKSVCMQFLRGCGRVKEYAFLGTFYAFLFCTFNIFLIVVLKKSLKGYLTSIIVSNLFVIIVSMLFYGLYKYLSIRKLDHDLMIKMIKYCVPLIINSLCWIVISSSDKFIINHFLGESSNGIYSFAHKIPNTISIVYSVFANAWIISAVEEKDSREAEHLYSSVFNKLVLIMTIVCGMVIAFVDIYVDAFVDESYATATYYIPILSVAVVLNCLCNNLGTIYTVYKDNITCVLGVVISAIINIVVHLLLINKINLFAASLSTIVAYLFLFIFRVFDTRRFQIIDYDMKMFFINFPIIIIQTVVHLLNIGLYGKIINFSLLAALIILNIKYIWQIFRSTISMMKKRRT